jgi:hypothetical protein
VAIRTQDTEVLQAVVVRVAVHVIERQRQWFSLPRIEPTALAMRRLQPSRNEASPKCPCGGVSRTGNENLLQWKRSEAIRRRATARPTLAEEVSGAETEPPDVSRDRPMHSTIRREPKLALDFRNRRALCDRANEIRIGP